MNEPEHPHFVLSDGQYCHVMPEGLIVSKKKLPAQVPQQNDNPDFTTLIFLGIGIAVLTFLIAMCAVTGMYVVVFLLGLLNVFMLIGFVRMIGFSQSEFVPRADINGVEYVKRNFGYDWFIVHYTCRNGKACKRRYVIYDSQECLNQALSVMKTEGLLT